MLWNVNSFVFLIPTPDPKAPVFLDQVGERAKDRVALSVGQTAQRKEVARLQFDWRFRVIWIAAKSFDQGLQRREPLALAGHLLRRFGWFPEQGERHDQLSASTGP
jgi:hypothetical protein